MTLHKTIEHSAESRHHAPGVTDEARLAERVFVRGEGTRLFDQAGNEVLDFAAGILTQAVGHSHPLVTERLIEQAGRLLNVHDSATPQREELCQKLAQVFPPHLSRFAFFSSGTEAVEAAIRAVYGFVDRKRTVIAALKSGFHGKTQGSRALVNWNIGHVNTSTNARQFQNASCFKCPYELSYPRCQLACAEEVAEQIRQSPDLAALVFEPIQTAAGVIVPPLEYWSIIEQACRDNNVLMVADEIVSAGGRTGAFLASERYGLKPDLVTAAKGLSSGIPFSLLAGREEIMRSGHFKSAGATSSTFGGNPLGCVAVTATLDVIESEQLLENLPSRSACLERGLRQLQSKDDGLLADVRGIGLLWALEFSASPKDKRQGEQRAAQFYQHCLRLGVRVGLGGNIVRVAPPLNVSLTEIEQATSMMEQALCKL